MTIKFFENHKCIATWKDRQYIPSKDDKVILYLYPIVKDEEIYWTDLGSSSCGSPKQFVYCVKERQWHENNIVAVVVEKLD